MAKNKNLSEIQQRALQAAKVATSGCPLMEGRDKANIEDFTGEELTIADAYPMTGEDKRYYCVTVDEDENIFFLSGGGLTKALDAIYECFDEDLDNFREGVKGICFRFENKRKTKNGRNYRPITIL